MAVRRAAGCGGPARFKVRPASVLPGHIWSPPPGLMSPITYLVVAYFRSGGLRSEETCRTMRWPAAHGCTAPRSPGLDHRLAIGRGGGWLMIVRAGISCGVPWWTAAGLRTPTSTARRPCDFREVRSLPECVYEAATRSRALIEQEMSEPRG